MQSMFHGDIGWQDRLAARAAKREERERAEAEREREIAEAGPAQVIEDAAPVGEETFADWYDDQ